MDDRRRASWVVLVRVDEKAGWCAYGPMTHREALEFKRRGLGTTIDHQLANLIPFTPPLHSKPGDVYKGIGRQMAHGKVDLRPDEQEKP